MEKDAADIMLAQGIYTVNVWVNVLASPPNQNFHLILAVSDKTLCQQCMSIVM